MEKLLIVADLEDYAVGLKGKLVINEFSGIGEGWHNNSTVLEFCSDLKRISKSMDGTAKLVGVTGSEGTSEYWETFSIQISPLDRSKLNGTMSVFVRMTDLPSSDCRAEEIRSVSGEMKVRNHNIEKFALDLRSLMDGSVKEVVLFGDNKI